MSEWKPDLRHQKTIGAFTLTPERRGNETAHLIESDTGRGLRVLPSDDISGLRRSQTIVGALLALEDLVWVECDHDQEHREMDPFHYLIGLFGQVGLEWESVGSLDECEHQIEAGGLDTAPNGETYATVLCARCGQKWWGMVSPMAASIAEVAE